MCFLRSESAGTGGRVVNSLRLLLLVVVASFFVGGCEGGRGQKSEGYKESQRQAPPPPPPPGDEGAIGVYLACKAQPRRELSYQEVCELRCLRTRCTAADDCLVSCLTSPDGYREGGGCEHVCFFGAFSVESKPDCWGECLK